MKSPDRLCSAFYFHRSHGQLFLAQLELLTKLLQLPPPPNLGHSRGDLELKNLCTYSIVVAHIIWVSSFNVFGGVWSLESMHLPAADLIQLFIYAINQRSLNHGTLKMTWTTLKQGSFLVLHSDDLVSTLRNFLFLANSFRLRSSKPFLVVPGYRFVFYPRRFWVLASKTR